MGRTNKKHRYRSVDDLKQKIVNYLQTKLRTDCDEGFASCTEISKRLGYHNQYVAHVLVHMESAGELVKESKNWRLANATTSTAN